jgi:hypothetical protein
MDCKADKTFGQKFRGRGKNILPKHEKRENEQICGTITILITIKVS